MVVGAEGYTGASMAEDGELSALLGEEDALQAKKIRLIASENYVSPAVRAAVSSVLINKYSEGYPGHCGDPVEG